MRLLVLQQRELMLHCSTKHKSYQVWHLLGANQIGNTHDLSSFTFLIAVNATFLRQWICSSCHYSFMVGTIITKQLLASKAKQQCSMF